MRACPPFYTQKNQATGMLWNLIKSRLVAVGREFKLVLAPWSLLLRSELDDHTFLRQSQGNKLGHTRSSGTINWQSVSQIWLTDTWSPPRSHHTQYSAHIYISAWSPRASEFVAPLTKWSPWGEVSSDRNVRRRSLFQEVEIPLKVSGEASEVFF